jgi:membrane protease YdiL (CAAX protease family)
MEAKQVKVRTLAVSVSAVLLVELVVRMTSLASSLFALGLTRFIQVLLMVWIAGATGGGTACIGLDRSGWFHGLRRGLIWSAAFGALALCAFFLLSLAGMNALSMVRTPLPHEVNTMVLFFLVGGIVAPVAEEIFFRGLLYGFFRRWGAAIAVILSTALFAFAHPLRNLPLTQLVGGLLFALAYEVEGNLLVPITIHVLGNLAIFALSAIKI